MTKLVVENSTSPVSTVTIDYTYLSNGYSMGVSSTDSSDEDNNYTQEATYVTQTINGVVLVKSFLISVDGTEYIKVNYARNGSTGEINNAVVRLSVKDNATGVAESIVGTLVRK